MRKQVIIVNLIDWSKSFVDDNGSFFCGTTAAQKERAGEVAELGDLVVFSTDTHPLGSDEFAVNGGLYPAHNVVGHLDKNHEFEYFVTKSGERLKLGEKTMSSELTTEIQKHIEGRRKGMIVPKEIYYQDGVSQPWFSPHDVEENFNTKIVKGDDFLNGSLDYVIAPKHAFDATRLESDIVLPGKVAEGIPAVNFNIFSLLRLKYPVDEYELTFVNTGVVEGICRLHTSIGLRQMFKSSRVINLTDATTPLAGIGMGFDTPEQSRDAAMRVCKDVGVEYMTTDEFLREYDNGSPRGE